MQRRMRTRSIRMMVAVLALSLSLTACDPQSLVSTFFEFFSGSGLQAPAAGAPEATDADDAAAADDAADSEDAAGADDAADDAAGDDAGDESAADGYHRKKDAGADEAPADADADAPGAAARAEAPAAPAEDAGDAANGLSAVEQEIFDTLNATRADAGLSALTLSADIAAGARDYSCTMAETGVFEHADIRAAGVNGENIAAGQQSAAQVHQGWMESPGHRDNRMSDRWTEYGVGVCEDDGGRPYYTERFR